MLEMTLTEVKALLGTPFYETDGFVLYNRDCLEAMHLLQGSFVDLTVTSPPYNIGKEYEKPLALASYLDWCQYWIGEIYRLTKQNGAFWLNLGYLEIPGKAKALPIPYLLWERLPFYLLQEVIWNYGAGLHTKRMFSPRNEKFLWCVKSADIYTFNLDDVRDKNVKYPNQKKNGKLKCNPLGKNPSDVWEFPKVTSGEQRSSKERTAHPAQFPLAVIDRIVKACSHENDIILDPFMGSGTTAVAALQTDRQVIGFEISEKYCQMAKERVQHFLRDRQIASWQQALFA
jgi:adenine-specific DNA-methyltransferase